MDTVMLNTVLAQASTISDGPSAWAPVVLLLIMGIGFAVANVILSTHIGPGRTGPGKEETYESGMLPIGDTRQRFNVRFYIVAMIFLVFDVEIVFFYPWASIFPHAVQVPGSHSTLLLMEMVLFIAILLVAYIYAWAKGIFRWD